MKNFLSFKGVVTMIMDLYPGGNDAEIGCYKLMSVENEYGALVNFVVAPSTYFVDHIMVVPGDVVTGFYDENVPVPLIFPPQYNAIVMAEDTPYQNVKVDYFNNQLVSSDNMLKLNIAPFTHIILENDQAFIENPSNRYLIVIYGATTKSIPAQTVPYKIIVMC
ncbi:hypothetical protein OW763_06980 [Clostridium aestuarii]|uniref:DUF4397 domain-containing protein n=1 Tax=Clostridium aestuarii TaxID=338193 RepID=A0ABT4CYQ9_9CLOT|nr:hypothetical protein [Clostridium aestuarii]MCY6484095.1 hypothetical protein [Clostridium aestuarii]